MSSTSVPNVELREGVAFSVEPVKYLQGFFSTLECTGLAVREEAELCVVFSCWVRSLNQHGRQSRSKSASPGGQLTGEYCMLDQPTDT